MLLDRYQQLLTAYVDGELSSRQRRHVIRLLHRSAEARQLLKQLKADARALRELPRPPLPTDFSSLALRLISEQSLTASRRRTFKADSAAAWAGSLVSWAAAAAVLLALGTASYLYFASSPEPATKTEMAQKQPESSVSTPPLEELDPPVFHKDDEIQKKTSKPPTQKSDRPLADQRPKVIRQRRAKSKSNVVEKQPTPAKVETALGERLETFSLERVPDLLPVVAKLSDLDRPAARKKLIAELRQDTAFRLELPCPNGTKAFDRVQNAARTLHIGLIIDKSAQERIKLKWRISYLLYIENVMPEELTEFVRRMDVEDRKSAAGKAAEAQFDRLVLTRMNAGHRKELATFLGVDPITTAPNTSGSLSADPRASLADTTARQVGQALAGQGGTSRPESGKPAAQPPQLLALVLAYNPIRPSPGSEEIKLFLESRKPARAGALRVLLVLRGS